MAAVKRLSPYFTLMYRATSRQQPHFGIHIHVIGCCREIGAVGKLVKVKQYFGDSENLLLKLVWVLLGGENRWRFHCSLNFLVHLNRLTLVDEQTLIT